MNRFLNMTSNQEIKFAIGQANNLLMAGSNMIEDIFKKNDWKFNSGSGASIAMNLLTLRAPIQVFTYRPFNPLTRAIGYYDGKAIHINIRKLPDLTHLEIVSNLVHEFSHHAGYSHGSNWKTEEKIKYSVPYYLSENIRQGKWL